MHTGEYNKHGILLVSLRVRIFDMGEEKYRCKTHKVQWKLSGSALESEGASWMPAVFGLYKKNNNNF